MCRAIPQALGRAPGTIAGPLLSVVEAEPSNEPCCAVQHLVDPPGRKDMKTAATETLSVALARNSPWRGIRGNRQTSVCVLGKKESPDPTQPNPTQLTSALTPTQLKIRQRCRWASVCATKMLYRPFWEIPPSGRTRTHEKRGARGWN